MGEPQAERRVDKIFAKVIVVGDTGTGKTCLVNQFCKSEFRADTRATVGTDFSLKPVEVDGTAMTLQIWDTAGQERYQSLGVAFYRGTDACILVFDLTNLKSFQNLDRWRDEFLIQTSLKDPENFPFVLIGTKVDLANQGQRQVQESKAKAWCANKGDIPYMETSAKEAINIESAFLAASHKALDKEQEPLKIENDQVIDINRDSSQGSGGGCCKKS